MEKKKTEYSEYKSYLAMCDRVKNKRSKSYDHIKICDRWLESFWNFLKDIGPRPSLKHSLDRIDNTGNYTPENCRWATIIEQNNNKVTNRHIEYNGKKQTIAEWSRETGLSCDTISHRLTYEWPIEYIFTLPAKTRLSQHMKGEK